MLTATDREARERRVLRLACELVGVPPVAEVVRLGENAIFRLQAGPIARVARRGQQAAAAKEAAVARWLADRDVPAVRLAAGIAQPIVVAGRAVTFWQELPAHEHGSPEQIGRALRRLHALPIPRHPRLGRLDPFVRLEERIAAAATLTAAERRWMREHLAGLRERWWRRSRGLPERVLHGDAWGGNVLHTADGRVVLADLERFAVGPPEWDLVHTEIKHSSLRWIGAADRARFRDAYGHDVTRSSDLALYRDIREFRMACSAAQQAAEDPLLREQAELRVACVQGRRGPRPWSGWRPML